MAENVLLIFVIVNFFLMCILTFFVISMWRTIGKFRVLIKDEFNFKSKVDE